MANYHPCFSVNLKQSQRKQTKSNQIKWRSMRISYWRLSKLAKERHKTFFLKCSIICFRQICCKYMNYLVDLCFYFLCRIIWRWLTNLSECGWCWCVNEILLFNFALWKTLVSKKKLFSWAIVIDGYSKYIDGVLLTI